MEYLNSIYYTLSTISQVLAGFIALSGVFILFKLQSLDKLQLIQVQYFYSYMSGSGLVESSFHGCPSIAVNLKTLRQSETTAGLLDEINVILLDDNVKKIYQYKSLQSMSRIISKIEKVKQNIKRLTISSIVIGVFTIIYSITILTITHMISKNDSCIFMNISLIFASISIITMTVGLIYSLKDYKLLK